MLPAAAPAASAGPAARCATLFTVDRWVPVAGVRLVCGSPPLAEPLPERRRVAVALLPVRRGVADGLLLERRRVAVAPDWLDDLLAEDVFAAADLLCLALLFAAARVRGLLAPVLRAAARVADAAEPRLAGPLEPAPVRRRLLAADCRLLERFEVDWRSAITFLPSLTALVGMVSLSCRPLRSSRLTRAARQGAEFGLSAAIF